MNFSKSLKVFIIFSILVSSLVFMGCNEVEKPDADKQQTQKTNKIMEELERQIGMPNINDFYEKKMLKNLYELRDNADLVTHAYFTNMQGKMVYLGKGVGFGLPASVQYSNPQKLVHNVDMGGYLGDMPMPQAEPNGLFMPEGLAATWLQIQDPETGEISVMYTEPELVVTQFKLPKRLCAEWSLPDNY